MMYMKNRANKANKMGMIVHAPTEAIYDDNCIMHDCDFSTCRAEQMNSIHVVTDQGLPENQVHTAITLI